MMVPGGRLVQMTARLRDPVIGILGVADGLAAVGVDAAGRVEASGLRGERGQLLPSCPQCLDVAVESRHVPFQQVYDVMAGGLSLAAQVEDGGDLGESQSGGLSVADEGQPVGVVLGVVPIVVGVTIGFGKKPYLFVIADRLCCRSGALRQFSDSHGLHPTALDLTVDWKV